MAPPARARTASLLFCHGTGFCKGVWNPVLQRLANAPLLSRQAPAVAMHNFTFSYHDANRRGVTEKPVLHLENEAAPRVTHSVSNWDKWAPDDIRAYVAEIRAQGGEQHTPLIGIGHSMGAGALLATEAANPGTFQGLILFEPICNTHQIPQFTQTMDFLVKITLQRRGAWDSFEEAEAELMASKNFAKWHPDALRGYIQGAVVPNKTQGNVVDRDAGAFVLACSPQLEAALYSSESHVRVDDDAMARIECPITFQYGSLTRLFSPAALAPIVAARPDRFSVAEPIPNVGHTMIMEDPDTVADRICDALTHMPAFQEGITEKYVPVEAPRRVAKSFL